MLDFLDLILGLGEVLASWRFFLCFALGAGAVFGVYHWLPDSWHLIVSIPVALVALVLGIIWERQSE